MILNHEKNKVSVIINVFNGGKYIRESIDSVLAQSYTNFEIIVWDNQSTDHTAEIVSGIDDPRILYFLAKEHTPLGEARNKALAQASGEIIGILDSDDLWLPEKLREQMPLFDDPEVGIVTCDTIFFDDTKDIKQLYRNRKPAEGYVFSSLIKKYNISLETVLFRRAALNSLDYWFDPRFEVIEEYDFFLRLSRNYKLSYVDKVLAKWRMHSSSWTWRKPDLFFKEKRMMIRTYCDEIPNFTRDYKNEIRDMYNSADLSELWHRLMMSDDAGARMICCRIICRSPLVLKYLLLYIILITPFHTNMLMFIRFGTLRIPAE